MCAAFSRAPLRRAAQRGMGLIDILVGMVIGLIGMIIVFQAFSVFEGQKRTTTAANDAQESGLMALGLIERDMRMGGYGFFAANLLPCSQLRWNRSTGAETLDPFMPVHVVDGASNASDTLRISYSTSPFGATPSTLLQPFSGAAASLVIDNPARTGLATSAAYRVGDQILVGNPFSTSPCTRLQVSAIDVALIAQGVISIGVSPTADAPHNPGAGSLASLVPAGGYTSRTAAPTAIINLGAFRRVEYRVVTDTVRGGRLVSLDLNPLPTVAASDVVLADGIVNLQAQYGVSNSATDQSISAWVNAAASPWVTPAVADIGRIKAVRVAIVARSQLPERDNVQTVEIPCVNGSGTNNNGPCAWRDTAAGPAPIIDLSATTDWRRYRYRVYETIIPLRNVMWQSF
jgi:type IV pilus assembly protein PilW